MVKTREQYLRSLDDGREVYFEGKKVESVADFEPFRPIVESFASVYDARAVRPDLLTFKAESGEICDRSWKPPTSYDDIVALHEVYEHYLTQVGQGLARTPPTGMMYLFGPFAYRSRFIEANPEYGKNIEATWRRAAAEDHLVCGAFPDPRGDRSVPIYDQEDPDLTPRIVEKDDRGIVVRGAKSIATAVPFAHDLLVSSLGDYSSEKYAPYALLAVIPVNLKGMKVICRRRMTEDNSDSAWLCRQDEMDAFLVFDDAHIPKDRIFYAGDWKFAGWYQRENMGWAWQGWWYAMQTLARVELLLGSAKLVSEYTGTARFPAVQEKLADIILPCETLRSLIRTAEVECQPIGDGLVQPRMSTAVAALFYGNEVYSRVLEVLRDIAGAFLVAVPDRKTLGSPELKKYFNKYFGYRKNTSSPDEKMALYQFIRDMTMSNLGGRLEYLQLYMSGNKMFHKLLNDRYYDRYELCTSRVKGVLKQYQSEWDKPHDKA